MWEVWGPHGRHGHGPVCPCRKPLPHRLGAHGEGGAWCRSGPGEAVGCRTPALPAAAHTPNLLRGTHPPQLALILAAFSHLPQGRGLLARELYAHVLGSSKTWGAGVGCGRQDPTHSPGRRRLPGFTGRKDETWPPWGGVASGAAATWGGRGDAFAGGSCGGGAWGRVRGGLLPSRVPRPASALSVVPIVGPLRGLSAEGLRSLQATACLSHPAHELWAGQAPWDLAGLARQACNRGWPPLPGPPSGS